jgi:predicted exporter
MATVGKARNACAASHAFLYQRHRLEKTLLYQLASTHHSVFRQHLTEEGRMQLGHVQRELENNLQRGRLEHGLLRVRC